MNIQDEKILMSEVAIMYYEKKHTQQEIANLMHLSRQTVSKLLGDAVKENIVEIKIHNPQKDREELQERILRKFGIRSCIVTGVSSKNESLRKAMTVKAAAEYITAVIKKGNQKIALSWGRTIQELIHALPPINTNNNIVFPLFGATDNINSYFASNELVRNMADKIGAKAQYAWFPYLTDKNEDCKLLKTLSYYRKIQDLWNSADLALLGIGNTEILDIFIQSFGHSKKNCHVIGDIATHFFDENGEFTDLYEHTLCASVENIQNARQKIAIACGDNKITAICGAMRTKLIDTLITDEHTARKILEC